MAGAEVLENAEGFPETGHVPTRVLSLDRSDIYDVSFGRDEQTFLESFHFSLREGSTATNLEEAARRLRTSDIPVAFPTETVYGLGAIATKSSAVQGIFVAKRRPADNPLIVHVCSMAQLRQLLQPNPTQVEGGCSPDPIPKIYTSVIKEFWPGPLTILLSNPKNSTLAPQVNAGLDTFSVRIPNDILALALIKLTGPLAAPSANSSTKPSTTTAEHVKHDLDGKIEIILDGGPCTVGVESTVIDGLSQPPCILRPGGISLEQLRRCEGWGGVVAGYSNAVEAKPKAPGMKYRHYSPNASVILYEAGRKGPIVDVAQNVGIVRTMLWKSRLGDSCLAERCSDPILPSSIPTRCCSESLIWEVWLGDDLQDIARELFSALRELDERGVDAIHFEGVPETDDLAATIMNRLRKSAVIVC
jgi:L-threonylcarbamoyladenylate synthase